MLTPANVRVLIILAKRALLKGDEAVEAAEAILKLEALYSAMTTLTGDPNGNHAEPSE